MIGDHFWSALGVVAMFCLAVVAAALLVALVVRRRWQQGDAGEREEMDLDSRRVWLEMQRIDRETAEERLRAERARRRTRETQEQIERMRLTFLTGTDDEVRRRLEGDDRRDP